MLNKEIKYTDISAFRTAADWEKLAEEVEATQQPRVLVRDGKEALEVRPAKPARPRRARSGPITQDDPLTRLIGIGHSGVGDIAENKHKYLAEAYLNEHKSL